MILFPQGNENLGHFYKPQKHVKYRAKLNLEAGCSEQSGGGGLGIQRSNVLRMSGVEVRTDLEGSPGGISSLTYLEFHGEHHRAVFMRSCLLVEDKEL